jgi:archaellum component FlaG (FlaF/FlaG flagellin family)
MSTRLLLVLFLAVAGCGQSISTPEDLVITTYPANAKFTLTLVMKACGDACAKYDSASCSVSIDGHTINVDAHVGYSRENNNCSEMCGPEVLAHCDVGPLQAGTYTVVDGSFRRDITVK